MRGKMTLYAFLFVVAAGVLSQCEADTVSCGTVYISSTGEYTFLPGIEDKLHGAAYGSFNRTINQTGWGVLNIAAGYYKTSGTLRDDQILTAAGILEGALTQSEIYLAYRNLYYADYSNTSSPMVMRVKQFFETQREWMEGMIASNNSTHWYYTNLIYAQFQGLMLGYSIVAPSEEKLDTFAFDLLGGTGDLLDIINFISPESRPSLDKMSKEQLDSYLDSGHCSALIKALPGYEDVFASHSSWYAYASMLRIFKHYAFNLNDKNAATQVMSFSSYPAFLSSLDDFYIMDSKLVMLETTNSIINGSLYDSATPKALLAWHRVRLANWLATGGEQWAGYISEYNSGKGEGTRKGRGYEKGVWSSTLQGPTITSTWVLDLKKITLKSDIADDALWVVEQIPGYVASGDQTPILRTGYWASYNIPFYEYVYNVSGYPELVEKYGPDYSYQLAPRAKIFRRDESKVQDMTSMEHIMRYNDYLHDPYSEGNPMKSICSRGDLQTKPSPGGCIDTKVTSYELALALTSWAQNGPTHDDLSAFNWSSSPLVNVTHVGQPTVFNFGFVQMVPAVP
eukprot:Em0001g1270a